MKPIFVGVFTFLLLTQWNGLGQSAQLVDAKITFEFPSKNVTGSIEGFESDSSIDLQNLEDSTFKGSVDAKTLDTNNFLRNLSLRSGRYFDVKTHPRIYFKSSRVDLRPIGFRAIGTLTLKGIQKTIEINFTKEGNTLFGTTSLYASDYGINIKKERLDNLVKINFSFELQ